MHFARTCLISYPARIAKKCRKKWFFPISLESYFARFLGKPYLCFANHLCKPLVQNYLTIDEIISRSTRLVLVRDAKKVMQSVPLSKYSPMSPMIWTEAIMLRFVSRCVNFRAHFSFSFDSECSRIAVFAAFCRVFDAICILQPIFTRRWSQTRPFSTKSPAWSLFRINLAPFRFRVKSKLAGYLYEYI